ncbi:hypothetical protein NC651_037365 [Populus alba x Populus x berolinensis]|nr:hypothetical protein NC651_037365 [Populus alba x Populus x berolinensis]
MCGWWNGQILTVLLTACFGPKSCKSRQSNQRLQKWTEQKTCVKG